MTKEQVSTMNCHSCSKKAGKTRVLVVDDEPRILRLLCTSLSAHGYEVITATNGEEALELARVEQPDIILLDVFLPVMDGFEVLQKLRSFSRLPVVAFSASNSVRDRVLNLGANDFVAKPFVPDDLVKTIETLLARRTGAE